MKRRVLSLILVLALLCSFAACSSSSGQTSSASSVAMDDYAPAEMESAEDGEFYAMSEESAVANGAADIASSVSAAPAEKPADANVRKIVYDADMRLSADDPSAALEDLSARAESLGGYVADASVKTDDEGVSRCSAVLKVPADRIDELVTAAKAAGKVLDYSLSSSDISQQYYDISARLASAKAEETQLTEILGQCTTVEDLLLVRESLAEVRANIESYQGQINLWDHLVSYATLELSISRTVRAAVEEEKTLVEIWRASDVWKQISRGFQNSARILVNVLSGIGIFLACAILPCGLLFLCIGLPIILHHKKKKRRKAEQAAKANAARVPIDVEAAPAPDAPKANERI